MLEKFKTEEEIREISIQGHKFLKNVEQSKKPVIAAIMGACLGGGLEVC